MQQGSSSTTTSSTATLTDEQILGLEPVTGASGGSVVAQIGALGAASAINDDGTGPDAFADDQGEQPRVPAATSAAEDPSYSKPSHASDVPEPAWLRALDAEPEAAAEARQWRQAALDAAAIDKDYFSPAPRDRAALAERLHQTDPAAFRAMLADAARILAERDPQGLAELARQLGGASLAAPSGTASKSLLQAARSASQSRLPEGVILSEAKNLSADSSPEAQRDSSGLNGGPQNDSMTAGTQGGAFPADTYRAFETAVNDDVARQVRDSIDRTLAATLPDGIADGARRRIGEDIFRDLNAALSTDRELSAQIGQMLRGLHAAAGLPAEASAKAGWRFDAATRQQLAGLLTGRARTTLPEVARRVVSEWTSSVLASDRIKQARIASATSRRDITGGRLPEPVASSALLPRRFDYARTSDEQILEM